MVDIRRVVVLGGGGGGSGRSLGCFLATGDGNFVRETCRNSGGLTGELPLLCRLGEPISREGLLCRLGEPVSRGLRDEPLSRSPELPGSKRTKSKYQFTTYDRLV